MSAVAAVALISVALAWSNNRWGSPVVAIVNRWLRWLVFAAGLALVAGELGWSDRPFWVLALSGFLLWFLGETIFNWMAIKALSHSTIPLFPKFIENTDAEEWPVQKRFLRMRDWLREKGFVQVQALKSDLGMGIVIRSFVFQSQDNRTRVQVLFVPQRSGNLTECFSFHSVTAGGIRLITDNLYIPFGGFYPHNWRVVRKAWIRNIRRLAARHEKRLRERLAEVVEWEESPVDDLNYQQMVLERVNTELGFLYPHHLRDEYGKISAEGRYRVWKEVWFLNYFGKSSSG